MISPTTACFSSSLLFSCTRTCTPTSHTDFQSTLMASYLATAGFPRSSEPFRSGSVKRPCTLTMPVPRKRSRQCSAKRPGVSRSYYDRTRKKLNPALQLPRIPRYRMRYYTRFIRDLFDPVYLGSVCFCDESMSERRSTT